MTYSERLKGIHVLKMAMPVCQIRIKPHPNIKTLCQGLTHDIGKLISLLTMGLLVVTSWPKHSNTFTFYSMTETVDTLWINMFSIRRLTRYRSLSGLRLKKQLIRFRFLGKTRISSSFPAGRPHTQTLMHFYESHSFTICVTR